MNGLVVTHWLGVAFHYIALAALAGFAVWLAASMLRRQPPEETPSPARQTASLTVKEDKAGLAAGTCYRFTDALSFGRSPSNDVVINEPYVSHEHACIIQQQKCYVLVDLGSRNGSTVNGRPCGKDTVLADGDVIGIGSVSFTFKG